MATELINQMLTSGIDTLVEYLTAHVMLCLVPAFFLSGAFNALIPTSTIFKYMGDGGGNGPHHRGLQLHHPPSVRWDMEEGRGLRPGHSLPLRWTGDHPAIDAPNGKRPRH